MASEISTTIILLLLSLLSNSLSSSHAQQNWIRGGYWYSDSQLPVHEINSALFTHLYCAFARPNFSTNKLFVNSTVEQNFSTFTTTVKRNNPSVTTLLSIFAAGTFKANYSAFFSMINQASTRKSFIDSSIESARVYGFEGLDLFFVPSGTSSDMINLGYFFKEWREAVSSESRNQSKLLLTMTIQNLPVKESESESVSYPIDSMKRNLDWVHIAAYDYYVPLKGNYTGAHSALYDPINRTNTNFIVTQWLNKGLPANKLVLGLPYHGYSWTLVNPNDDGLVGALASGPALTIDGSMGYKLIKSFIRNYGYGATSIYNDTYVVNHCTIGSNWINFDDVESIRDKVSYAREKGLLGYAAFQLNNDDNWVLSRAAHGEGEDQHNTKILLVKILLPIAIVILLVAIMMCFLKRRIIKSRGVIKTEECSLPKFGNETSAAEYFNGNDSNLQEFSFAKIKAATNNFSSENKLGEGGYGPVYKGKLSKGQIIAVKRLSKTSHQGLEEFKNEVMLTAKLQHVNLVRVLGYCTQKKEKMLIYEYMPNKSLDFYLFDPLRRHQLDWEKRVHVIEGVTQGLLYLQEYSNFTIIHRDLKGSNILLDSEMNPKISDFGIARIFGKDELEANTGRIVGTYGCVPPEYVRKGVYSMKYDVYSFGVLLLQIISGKKSTCLYGPYENLNLLDYAYGLWQDGRWMEFIDPSLDDSSSTCKLYKCLQIALLCVQDDPADRPSMLEIFAMFKNETAVMATPKMPAFSIKRYERTDNSSVVHEEICSVNGMSSTQMLPR